MGIVQDNARLNEHLSQDAFDILPSAFEGAGMACFAANDLDASEVVLEVDRPIASVILSEYRKEICSWCYYYEHGTIHKYKCATPKGRGVAWFCQELCKNAWRSLIGDAGWEATVVFEDGLARTKQGDGPIRMPPDGPCDLETLEQKWEAAALEGYRLLASRRAKPSRHLKTATLPSFVDLDIARFILSALISFNKAPETLNEALRLTPSLTPYLSSWHTLDEHIAIYHYLLSVLPLDSPIMQFVTPFHIIATITRDAGNSWGIWDQTLDGRQLFAYCMYPTASYFNHSCEPNVTKDRSGRVYQFTARDTINKGSEMNVSYLGDAEGALDLAERRKRLREGWFFECHCTKCLRESSVT